MNPVLRKGHTQGNSHTKVSDLETELYYATFLGEAAQPGPSLEGTATIAAIAENIHFTWKVDKTVTTMVPGVVLD